MGGGVRVAIPFQSFYSTDNSNVVITKKSSIIIAK